MEKRNFLRKLLLGISFVCLGAENAYSGDIFEVLAKTYNSNPTLQAERASVRAVDENVAIAKTGYRPNISAKGGYRDGENKVKKGVGNDGDYDSLSGSLNASQPLFNGYSTVNSVKAADRTVKAAQNNLANVEQNILTAASTAYLDVLQNRAIVALQKNNEELLKKKLDETLERFKVGEVTRTDVSQAKARYSQAISDRIASEGNLQSAVANYIEYVGEEPDELSEPVKMKAMLPNSYDTALDIALKNNYTIRQAQNLYAARGYAVYSNIGELLPSLSLDGSIGRNKSEQNHYKSTVENAEWGVNLSVPLYAGGSTNAKIRQSKYQKWQAQEEVLSAKRAVRAAVKSAWENMKANESQLKSIADQIDASRIALDGVQKEEALGNRTILDVLDAYQELLNSEVNDVKARRSYYVSAMNLLASMGRMTAKSLGLNVELYDANKYYQETKDKWISLD
ncbi:MAG: TolC family outer membrane protein [Alphaproteobacteria bacterium]|nr:TolC family outer membrane protein [Alphaproteobacteria bacterium]